MKLIFDEYTWKARFFPAIISALPLLALCFFLFYNTDFKNLMSFLFSLKFVGSVSISIILLYLYSQIIRILSKYFQNIYFTKADGFPSTYLMLYNNDTFSDSYKDKFRELIKNDFGITLKNKAEESKDKREAVKLLNEANKQIILKVKNGHLVLSHNIWYGFFRNLIGGSIFSILFCIANMTIALLIIDNEILFIFSCVILCFYLVLFLFKKHILVQTAEDYAQQLIAEYLNTSKDD